MEHSNLNSSATKEFERAAMESLTSLAKDFGLDLEQIDSCLFMLSSESITIKVYFPESHGYDVDVKISPTLSRDWYSAQEKSIFWIGQFLGLGEFVTSRGTSQEHIARLVRANTDFLRQTLPHVISASKNFWEDLSRFIEEQTSKEDERK